MEGHGINICCGQKETQMHSSLVGRFGQCWVVELPDGDQHVLSGLNVVTGGVPAFVGMEGIVITLTGGHGRYRRFFARWTSGSAAMAVVPPEQRVLAAISSGIRASGGAA
jgi:hypothetical protein